MSANRIARPPLSAWKAGLLRLTAFPSPSAQLDGDWWQKLVGQQPENRRQQPRTREQIDEGNYEKGKLILSLNPSRVDWQYTQSQAPSLEITEVPALDSFTEALEVFRELMNRWFSMETCPSLVRLAFGAVLLQPVESRIQGYKMLSLYVPFQVDVEETSDFLYQINRLRASGTGINGLKINRLMKWSVLQIRQSFLSIVPRGQPQHAPELFACRLELDINTIDEYEGEFTPEQLPQLFDELVEFGKEIAEQGDIR